VTGGGVEGEVGRFVAETVFFDHLQTIGKYRLHSWSCPTV
jgi:hypothetical protein